MNAFIMVIIVLFAAVGYADDKLDYFSFTAENDALYNLKDDGLYSNGLIMSWGYDDIDALDKQSLPDWLAYLAEKSYLTRQQDKHYSINYGVAHLLQTAIDLSATELIEEDAPYVGLFAWKGQLSTYDQSNLDRLGLTLGLVGPITGAEFMQRVVHKLIGSNNPQGWDNQIGNEFVFQLQAERLWRIYNKTLAHSEFDLITGVNGGLGNYRSDIGTGVGWRWGQGLQNNFSSASAFPVQKLNFAHYSGHGWYLFANASAFYVANDIFMSGNTFQESHSVDLIHLQYGASLGMMANIYNWNFFYTLVLLSDQYEGQNERSRFGSITVSYPF